MPIFDKNLTDKLSKGHEELQNLDLSSATDFTQPISPISNIGGNPYGEGFNLDQMSKIRIGKSQGFEQPFAQFSYAELEENKKYPVYRRDTDLENVYGLQQSAWSQWGNSLAKFGATSVGIFTQGFAAIPNIIDAYRKKDFSQLSGDVDGFEGSIDTWLENMENSFPNYYTRKEKDSPWIAAIPFATGSANFYGDKFLKNLGFTVGAIGSALVQDAIVTGVTGGTGTAPLIAAQVAKFSLFLNKLASVTGKGKLASDIAKTIQASAKTGNALKGLGVLAGTKNIGKTAQFYTTMFGASITEAGVESREGYKHVKESLIEDYVEKYGYSPKGEEAAEIEKLATDSMNIRFGINTALLLASNSLLFGNMAKNFKAAGGSVKGAVPINKGPLQGLKPFGLVEKSLDQFELKKITSLAGKAWEATKNTAPIMVSEGIWEEGGQFATEKGTYDYFTRKYKNLNNPKNREGWNTVDESIRSLMHGLSEQFTTDEGWQNMFIGALTGMFVTGVQSRIDKVRKTDPETRTNKVINELNKHRLSGIFKQQHESAATMASIDLDLRAAVEAQDVFKADSLVDDLFIEFVHNRSSFGAHEATIEQLNLLRNLSKEQFEEMFHVDFSESSKETVNSYTDLLIEKANKIDAQTRKLNSIYSNPFTWNTNPEEAEEFIANNNYESFEGWKRELVYGYSKLEHFNTVEKEAEAAVLELTPNLTGRMVSRLMNRKTLNEVSEEYDAEAKILEGTVDFATSARERTKIRKQVKSLKNLAGRASILSNNRNLSPEKELEYFTEILNFENNFKDLENTNRIPPEDVSTLRDKGVDIIRATELRKKLNIIIQDLSSKKGFEKYLESEKDVLEQTPPENPEEVNFVNEEEESETLELNRKYENSKVEQLAYKKINNNKWEVPKPDGTKIETKTEAQAKVELKDTNDTLKAMSTVIVLSILLDGSIKIQDNEGDIYNIDPSKLKGYKKVKSIEEFVGETKEDIEKAEEAGGLGGASVSSKNIKEAFAESEKGRRKSAEWLFLSSTTDSETAGDKVTSPHVSRSRMFLDRIKMFPNRDNYRFILVTPKHVKSLGIDGIVEQSYKGNVSKDVLSIDKGWMASVFVYEEVDKITKESQRWFVDKNGKKLTLVGETADLNEIIYQTVPTTSLFYDGKTTGPKFRENQKEDAQYKQKQWIAFREDYFKDENTEPLVLEFTVSRGIPYITNNARNNVNHLIPENVIGTDKDLIQIPTSSFITFDGESLAVPSGVPMLVYKDILEFLQNRKFTKDEATAIYESLKIVADSVNNDLKNYKKPSLLSDHWNFIQQVMFTKSKGTTETNQLRVNIGARYIQLGKEKYFFDDLVKDKTKLITQLTEVYQNVNNKTLLTNFDGIFTEYYINSAGSLDTREWTNYQTYLLSSKNIDGSARKDIPLTTNIDVPTEGVPYTHIAKYIKFHHKVSMPTFQKEKPPQGTDVDPVIVKVSGKDFNLDGQTENTWTFKKGDITFTGTVGENSEVVINIISDEKTIKTHNNISNDPATLETFFEGYEDLIKKPLTPLEKEENTIEIIKVVQSFALKQVFEGELKTTDKTPPVPPAAKKKFVFDGTTVNTHNIETETGVEVGVDFVASIKNALVEISIVVSEENDKAFAAIANSAKIPKIKEALVAGGNLDNNASKEEVAEFYINVILFQEANLVAVNKNTEPSTKNKPQQNKKRPGRNFREVGYGKSKGPINTMTLAEEEIFKKWHAENLPLVPYEVLLNMIKISPTREAYGVFEDSTIKFVRGSLKGTEYHEAGEAIWNGMLSLKETRELTEEFRNEEGSFVDRASGKTYLKSDITVSDQMVKERILDDFSDFRLKKIAPKTLGQRILAFFNRIMNFFRTFNKKKTLKEKLFDAIDAGRFKKTRIDPLKNISPQYRAVEGLSEQEAEEYVEDMTATAFALLFDARDKQSLFELKPISKEDLFRNIYKTYNAEDFDRVSPLAWEQLVQRTLDRLRATVGLDYAEDESLGINEEDAAASNYVKDPFTVDSKETSPQAVKILLNTLFKTESSRPNNYLEKPEYLESPILGLLQLVPYTKVFGTLIDKLHNTTDPNVFIKKLIELADENNDYIRLFERLGGTFVRKNNKNGSYINFKNFNKYDWDLFIEFYQVFSKQHPDAYVQYYNRGDNYSIAINKMASAKQIREAWIDRIKLLAEDPESIIFYDNPNRVYKVRPFKSEVKEQPDGTFIVKDSYGKLIPFATKPEAISYVKTNNFSLVSDKKKLEFLNSIGISFDQEMVSKMSKDDKISYNKAIASLFTFLGKNNELATLSGTTLAINQPFLELANLYIKVNGLSKQSTHFGLDDKPRGNYSFDNAPSLLENDFNETANVSELKNIRPELNDVYSENSLILTPGTAYSNVKGSWKKRLKISYIQGTKDLANNAGELSSKLVLSNRFVQEINQNLNGQYYIMMPADGATEWMINMGNNISFKEMYSSKKLNSISKIFLGYLEDEINLALDYKNRDYVRNIKGRGQELRMFKDILSSDLVEKIESMIKSDLSITEIMGFVKTNKGEITDSVYDFVKTEAAELKRILLDSNKIEQIREGVYSYEYMDSAFASNEQLDKNQLSEKELTDLFEFVAVNTAISNIEMHKILFGDPFLFKTKQGTSEAIKRIKSFLSPSKKLFNFSEYDSFLKDKMNVTSGGVALTKDDYGYQNFKDHARTTVLASHMIAGSLSNILSVYGNTDVTDGFSWLKDSTYREIMQKNGQWPDQAEAFYQWQMAYTRQNIPGYTYTNKTLEKQDAALVKTPAPKYYLKIVKPIVRGSKSQKQHIDLIMDKLAQMPVFYSMVKGTNMEKQYIKMFKEDIDYAIVESGRKIGVEQTHPIYNKKGEFNIEPYNNISNVPWSIYSIQVETAHNENKKQSRGTQITKMATLNLFENGEAIGATPERKEYIRSLYNENQEVLNQLHRNAYNGLLKKLGIEESDGNFTTTDGKKISDTLVFEMLRRNVNENTKDSIKLDENDQFIIPFEASPSYTQIKDIMYSLINKSILNPKMGGAPHVQVPSTLFEQGNIKLAIKQNDTWIFLDDKSYEALSEKEKEKVVYTDDSLKFYENEDGKRYCEIKAPHWFKDKLSKLFKTDEELLAHLNSSKELQEILKGIGFRIPTQAGSSIEVFKIVGFLPQYMGATVVVPAEITTKTGGDFDIDKLNMYLKNIYLDSNKKIKLNRVIKNTIENISEGITEEQRTKQFYASLFDTKLGKSKFKIKQIIKNIEKGNSIKNIISEDDKGYQDIFNEIFGEIFEEEELKLDGLYEILGKLNDTAVQEKIKDLYVDSMYTKSLENEYFISLEKLLTLEENFEFLISPINDGGYKAISEKINSLKGKKQIKNQLISKTFLTKKRNAFALAKAWIGIAAVNITGLANRQKTAVVFDTSKIIDLGDYYKKWIGDGSIQLPHNTVIKNGKESLTISGTTTAEEQVEKSLNYLSNRLSGFATATVDVATDDYILDVYPSGLLISTAMFMEASGMGDLGRMFLAQPIIERYVQKLDYNEDKRLHNEKNIEALLVEFPVSSSFDPANNLIDLSKLEENIQTYAEAKDYTTASMISYNEQQYNILQEFLKYAILGKEMFLFNQAINYDTSRIRNGEEYMRKEILTQRAEDFNLFSSVQEVLDNTFIGYQKEMMTNAVNMFGTVFTLDQPKFKTITNEVLKKYAEREFLTNDDFTSIIQSIKINYLDYILQTNRNITEDINDLLLGDNNIAVRLEKAKYDYPNIGILQELEIDLSQRRGGAKTIRLRTQELDFYSDNYYIGLMRELRDANKETKKLYNDLITVAILQGSKRSNVSIKHIIPVEDYSKIVTDIIESTNPVKESDLFSKGMFERNNFSDPKLWPVFTPRFKNVDPAQDGKNLLGKNSVTQEIVYFYTDNYYGSHTFPSIPSLGIKKSERKLMLIKEQYNSKLVQSEFLKVPRVITVRNEEEGDRIEFYDIKEDTAISYQEYKLRKEKGDSAHYDFIGYQRVKLPNGEFMSYTDDKGNDTAVYKQINILGEGKYLKEFYTHFRPSLVENGSVKVKGFELTDAEIIEYYSIGIDNTQIKNQIAKDEYSFLPLQEVSMEGIKNGTKTITNRKGFFNNGTYSAPDGSFVSLKLIAQAVIVEKLGKPIVLFTDGTQMSVEEFSKKEGFTSWEDFKTNAQYSDSFINYRQPRFIYNIYPVQLTKEEAAAAQEAKNKSREQPVQLKLFDTNETRPHFDALPTKEETGETMTYAGVGSRETPNDILTEMKQVATFLSNKGYTLFSGGAQGADAAFALGTDKKQIFNKEAATDFTRNVAKETHPNPGALKEGAVLDLMARNTFQIFGKDLNSTVDFVLAYTPLTKEGKVVTRAEDRVYYGKKDPNNTGGTGQAIAMASMKGIPVINLADRKNWRKQLQAVLEKKSISKKEEVYPGVEIIRKSNIEIVDRYSVKMLKDNPSKTYVFGDNAQRKGKGGQAIIRDESNAFGIVTKLAPNNTNSAFMSDVNLSDNIEMIDRDIAELKDIAVFKTLVFPKDGIGTGLAQLKEKAPKTFAYLNRALKEEFGFENRIENRPEQKDDFLDFAADVQKQIAEDLVRKLYSENLSDKDFTKSELAAMDAISPNRMIELQQEVYSSKKVTDERWGSPEGVDGFFKTDWDSGEIKSGFTYKNKSIETEFPLSKDQTEALEKMIDWYYAGDPRFVLQGAAGTGKTSLIGYLQKYLGERKVLYMAPTHAATIELAFGTMRAGNKTFPATVPSSVYYDQKKGKMSLTNKAKERLGFGKLLVVDETSMLSTKDYSNLVELEDQGYKIIFVGDKKQIPEVTSSNPNTKNISMAFTENPGVNLDVIHRTSNKEIKNVLQKIRDSIKFQLFKIKTNTENLKFFSSDLNFNRQLAETVKEDPENTDYIGYTNSSVSRMNKLIREEIFGRTGEVQADDIVIGYLGYANKQVEEGNLANSVSFVVDLVQKRKDTRYNLNVYSLTLISKKLRALRDAGFDVPANSRTNFAPLSKTGEALESNLTEEEYNENNVIFSDKFKRLNDAYQTALASKGRGWAQFYRIREDVGTFLKNNDLGADYIYDKNINKMVMYDKYDRDQNNFYYKMYGNNKGDYFVEKGIDYGHAITVHKSQGRTTKNVFFDANTIGKRDINILENGGQISTERQSLGYVGMSRASNNLYVNMGWVPFTTVGNVDSVDGVKEVLPTKGPNTLQQTEDKVFKIDHLVITLKPDGTMYFKDGREVTNATIRNKVLIAKEYAEGVLRIGTFNNSTYFVLTDNRILGAGKTNKGKESVTDAEIRNKILAKAIIYKKEC